MGQERCGGPQLCSLVELLFEPRRYSSQASHDVLGPFDVFQPPLEDRSPPARRNHLQRTAGPYIGSKSEELTMSTCFPLCPRTRTLPDAVGTSCAPQADIGSLNRSTRLLDRTRRAEPLDRTPSEHINLILIEELEVASDVPFAAPVIVH